MGLYKPPDLVANVKWRRLEWRGNMMRKYETNMANVCVALHLRKKSFERSHEVGEEWKGPH
jgi:hypothetical protein